MSGRPELRGPQRCAVGFRTSPRAFGFAALACALAAGLPAQAHDYRAGDIRIDHPYAVPTPAGSPHGAFYLRALRNTGTQPDRLVGARTPVAASVEIHRSELDAQQVMHMRSVPAIDLPAGSELRLMHGGAWHLMLIGLKAPLRAGDRFPVTLRFERGGEREVTAWVQSPRDAAAVGPSHAH